MMVVFPDGSKQLLGLSAALSAAAELQLDLVEVNGRTTPPVARILDHGKMLYEQQQKAEAADKARRLQQKMATPKEMQFSARIADHDLEVKMRKVTEWLEQGYRVQLVVKHRREEEAAAAEALTYLSTRLQSEFKVDVGPQQVQRKALTVLIKPLPQQQQQHKQQQ